MSIYERKYQRTTRNQIEKCIRWCQNKLNLRDWEVDLYLTGNNTKERMFGYCEIDNPWQEQASIWVDLEFCKEKNINPYSTVCHEMIHILVTGKYRIDVDSDEGIARTFEDMLYKEFCKQTKIKLVSYQEK